MTHTHSQAPRTRTDAGFTLIELLVSMAVLLIVSGTVFDGVLRLSNNSIRVNNRTAMHAGVRNATELLQQEVGQAGRVALPNTVRLAAAVAAGTSPVGIQAVDSAGAVLGSVSGVSGMFVNEQVVVGTGATQETVTITAVDTANNQITALFALPHAAGEPVSVYGGFAAGVIPPSVANGSTGSTLKIFGDVNSDGNMVYVEYTCDTANGNLYRRSVPFTAATKPALAADQTLLNNIEANPDGTACFTYQQRTVNNVPYVVDVAITLTVRTPDRDPVTRLFERETKALLNVAPRNVFNVWQLAGLGINNRIQPMPASIQTLMAQP